MRRDRTAPRIPSRTSVRTGGRAGVRTAAGALLLVAFVGVLARRREPLMPLRIWRAPNLAAANIAQLLLAAAWIPMWFFLNLYLQQVLGYGAFPSGAALLPMTLLMMLLMTTVTGRLIGRFGLKPLIVTGLLVLAAGLGLLSLARPGGDYLVDGLPGCLIAALGMSLVFIPATIASISGARPEEAGLASGIVNTTYQVGSALGLAAMTAVATAWGADRLGDPAALTDGFSVAFIAAAVIALAAAVLTAAVMRPAKAAQLTKAA